MWVGLLLTSSQSPLQAQTPGWQPNRLTSSPSMQPLPSANPSASGATQANSSSAQPNAEAGSSGVVLRWRTSARIEATQPTGNTSGNTTGRTFNQANGAASGSANGSANGSATSSLAARALDANSTQFEATRSDTMRSQPVRSDVVAPSVAASFVGSAANPLRSSTVNGNAGSAPASTSSTFVPRGSRTQARSAVQPANFQAPAGNAPAAPGGNSLLQGSVAPPSFPSPNNAPGDSPNLQAPPALNPPGNFPPSNLGQDALNLPEDAPAPPVAPREKEAFPQRPDLNTPPAQDSNPASPMPDTDNDLRSPKSEADDKSLQKDDDSANPFKNRSSDDLESPSDRESQRRSRDLEKKKDQPDSSANCESFRDKLRNSSIQKINLNAAPRYGQGLSDNAEKSEKQRLDFASSSEVRDWCDRHGRTLIQGRMIDLINEQVVLDINGARREIPLRDLCDVDLAYVGKVWHLPVTCGSGYDQVAGRSFVPSAIQWKASGLCHKPLYFEEVQLERYGHEIGPVLQPLVSTAHFFGNIAVLPYKMGIHPPQECQYALGYYRPGDCAPYMLPPVPISLRGALMQAGAAVGGAALVP